MISDIMKEYALEHNIPLIDFKIPEDAIIDIDLRGVPCLEYIPE